MIAGTNNVTPSQSDGFEQSHRYCNVATFPRFEMTLALPILGDAIDDGRRRDLRNLPNAFPPAFTVRNRRAVPQPGDDDGHQIMGFFTDTTSASAARRARSRASSGTSSPPTASTSPATATTTPATSRATTWRHVAFKEKIAEQTGRTATEREPLADDERRLQALRGCPLPALLPDRRDHLQRVRRRLRPERHLQRLRLLRRRLPVRRPRPRRQAASPRRRPRPQMHALHGPPGRRT